MNETETMKPARKVAVKMTVHAHPETIKIVKLFSSGHTIVQVSHDMGINKRTLEKKVSVMKEAYGVNTIAELVAFFMSRNLIRYKKR